MTTPDGALQDIEVKLAFLERANVELSDVLYRQQREIEVLHARLALLEAQIAGLGQASQLDDPLPSSDIASAR
jgi:uncharacterized coiled-coil protein SlyX